RLLKFKRSTFMTATTSEPVEVLPRSVYLSRFIARRIEALGAAGIAVFISPKSGGAFVQFLTDAGLLAGVFDLGDNSAVGMSVHGSTVEPLENAKRLDENILCVVLNAKIRRRRCGTWPGFGKSHAERF